jgi:hypothetical protein
MTMPSRMAELALRKRMLCQRSAVLRLTLGIQINQGMAPMLGRADQVITAGRWLRRHPAWLVGGAVALLVWRPAGLTRWAGRGLWLWQAWQKVQPMVQPMVARLAAASAASAALTEPPRKQP